MKHCISCDQFKPLGDFPSPGAITCSFCTEGNTGTYNDRFSSSDALGDRGDSKHPYIGSDGNTHSMGIRPHPHNRKLARDLLNAAHERITSAPKTDDKRPLIDLLHEATFTDTIGLQWIAPDKKYELRGLLRKAHCFTLDAETSGLVSDFSLAIARDLDAARQMAIPPFPVTWVELDQHARLNRLKAHNIPLTATAAGESEAGEAVSRVGWLIWPATDLGGYYMVYATQTDQSMVVSPLAWWWHTDTPQPLPREPDDRERERSDEYIEWLTFGMRGTGVLPNAYVCPSSLHIDYDRTTLFPKGYKRSTQEAMRELAGELRHVFGLLIALAAGHGTKVNFSPQAKPQGPMPTMKNGKPLFPLEHKHLHIHLNHRITAETVVVRAIHKVKMREHDVRGHWRTLRNPDGTVRKRVPVKDHKRGDKALGVITKTYHVER